MTWYLRHRFLVPLSPAIEHCQIVLGTQQCSTKTWAVHFSILLPQDFLWSQGSLLSPCAREAKKSEGDIATCSNTQLMGDRILWINTPAWDPLDEQFWATFDRVPQRIPSRIDTWLLRSLTNSKAFPFLSHSPRLLSQLFGSYLPNKVPPTSSYFKPSFETVLSMKGI